MSHYRTCKHANGSFTTDMAKTNGLVYHWYFVGQKQLYIYAINASLQLQLSYTVALWGHNN